MDRDKNDNGFSMPCFVHTKDNIIFADGSAPTFSCNLQYKFRFLYSFRLFLYAQTVVFYEIHVTVDIALRLVRLFRDGMSGMEIIHS